ncbi:MAG: hypothetical protein RL026_870 [Pseudomonadota bacterium]|jgi:iron complex outermembrane receptor protein
MKGHQVTIAVRHAILGVGLVALAGAPSWASAAEDEVPEEIVVTGSRVRGAQPVGSAVTTVGRDEIDRAGQISTDRILKELPQNFDLGVSENSRGQSGGAGNIVYGNTVNLRGIGPYATLVIVDGHRVVNNSRSTDPSIIPTLGLERVEVVADGASAVYGSDAVAGVVNLIPRRSLDGIEAFGRYGLADGGYNENVVGGALGRVFDRGQFMLAYEHASRDALSGDDRDFFRSDQTASGGRDYRITRCNPGTLKIGAVSYAIPAGGLTAANVGGLVAGTSNKCDELVGQDLSPEQNYDSVNATASYEFNDTFEFVFDGFFSRREFSRFPAYGTATLTVPQTNAWFVRPDGFAGSSYSIDYSFINDFPRNISTGFAENWQVSPALRVKLPARWQFEAVASYGENSDNSETLLGVSNGALNAALASSNPSTAFDPYGLGRTTQAVRDGIANQIFLAPTLNDFRGYEARFNGPLFAIGGGEVAVAAGYERQEHQVDLGSARGNPGTATTFRHFERDVDSLYAELNIPLVGAANARAGLQRLTVNAAVRHDSYSDVGDTTNGKFGVSFMPAEGLTFRGSYGTSFRAPLISQIYGNSNNLFAQSYQNPAGGAPLPGIAYSGPNLNLGPEEARTWSVGVDFEPTDEFKLGLTFWDVLYENQVETYLSNLALLARESEFAGTGIILRGTEARDRVLQLISQGVTLAGGTFPGGSANNVTLYVDGRNNNLGKSETQGIDFQARYRVDTAANGRFTFNVAGTYITGYDVAITSVAPLLDKLDTIFNPLDLKLRASVTWDREPFSVQLAATHVGGYTNNAVTPSQSVGSYTPVDLSVSWQLGDADAGPLLGNLVLGLEARNLFDQDPPYVNIAPSVNGSGGYDATASNPVGRLLAVSLRKRW